MKIKQTLIALNFLVGLCTFSFVPAVSAANCGGVETSAIGCTQSGGKNVEDSGLWGFLLLVINILSAGVGIAAVGGVVWGSILYTTARGSLEQTKKAKVVIANTILGIIAYLLMFSFLNYLIPGGVFN